MRRDRDCPFDHPGRDPRRSPLSFPRLGQFGRLSTSCPNRGRPRIEKKTFLLLEILIGLSLAGILLGFLFVFTVQNARGQKKTETARTISLTRTGFQTRMQDIFLALDLKVPSPFYTEEGKLIFIFDQGVDPDPAYSGTIRGKLFLDPDKNIVLETSPLSSEEEPDFLPRKEILFAKTGGFEIELLGGKHLPILRELTPTLAWHKEWPSNRSFPPSQVRFLIKENTDTTLYYAFHIAFPDQMITYQLKGAG
jgi:hypothetical protein